MKGFRTKNISEAYYLEKSHKTFWEIKFEQNAMKTIIRCGKLQENGQRDENKLLCLEKKHISLREVVDFISERVDIKLKKGYQLKNSSPSENQFLKEDNFEPRVNENLGKRKNDYIESSDIPASQPAKKVHLNHDEKKYLNQTHGNSSNFLENSNLTRNEIINKEDELKSSLSKMKKESPNSAIQQEEKEFKIKEEVNIKDEKVQKSLNLRTNLNYPYTQNQNYKTHVYKPLNEFNFNSEYVSGKSTKSNIPELAIPSEWQGEDPKRWYLSEKLNGTRCYWDGNKLTFSEGKINIPDYFIIDLQHVHLEGVLIEENITSIRPNTIPESPSDPRWNNNFIFYVYDAPQLKLPFEKRRKELEAILHDQVYVKLHSYTVCEGLDHAQKIAQEIKSEAIIFTDPLGPYIKGKSNYLLETTKTRIIYQKKAF